MVTGDVLPFDCARFAVCGEGRGRGRGAVTPGGGWTGVGLPVD